MTAVKRYGAYHRISDLDGRDIEAETTNSDKVAFETIDAWAKMRGVKIAERYLDVDQSGSKLSRPAFDRMLDDLRAGRIDGIVVEKVDRLSRADVGDALSVIKDILDIAPDSLVLLDLGIDPSTEFGEFGLTVLLALARMQWRRYKRQYRTGVERAIKRGVWIGPEPLGLVRQSDGTLARHPDTADVMTQAFSVAATDGLHAAGDFLTLHFPDRRWRTSDVRRQLSLRVYLGEIVYGDVEPWRAADHGIDLALTDPATFAAAQTAPRSKRGSGNYPLSGIATCASCGASMVGALQTARGRTYRRMRCSAVCKGGAGSVTAESLENYVREQVRARLGDGAWRLSLDQDGLAAAEAALRSAEVEADRFAADTEAHELMGDAKWREHLRARYGKVNDARGLYQEIASRTATVERLPFADEVDDDAGLVAAVRAGVASITVSGGRLPIDQRVVVTFVNDDDDSGVLAA